MSTAEAILVSLAGGVVVATVVYVVSTLWESR